MACQKRVSAGMSTRCGRDTTPMCHDAIVTNLRELTAAHCEGK